MQFMSTKRGINWTPQRYTSTPAQPSISKHAYPPFWDLVVCPLVHNFLGLVHKLGCFFAFSLKFE
jgi:hypothetical protein